MKPEEFGNYLKELRLAKKLTMRQLDLYSSVSHSYISQMERGIRGIPSPDILKKLAKPLGIEYEELMTVAGYIKAGNEAVDLIDKLLLKISDDPRATKVMNNTELKIPYAEFISELTLEEKLEAFLILTENLNSVHISTNEDGTKDIGFGRATEVYDIEDENFTDSIHLTYKGMELTREEKTEFMAILRAILDARRAAK